MANTFACPKCGKGKLSSREHKAIKHIQVVKCPKCGDQHVSTVKPKK